MKQITLIRKNKNLTQKQLADRVGVRTATISDIETGRTASPGFKILNAIAKELDCAIEVLLSEVKAA